MILTIQCEKQEYCDHKLTLGPNSLQTIKLNYFIFGTLELFLDFVRLF